jgi:hypothetical protein
LRLAGVHICYNQLVLRPFMALGFFLTPTKSRARMRLHYGTFLLVRSAY